jgi:crotonobetainyl-CoA:carnitine CoA-transferase CaiB-like acyl-CoA transferase
MKADRRGDAPMPSPSPSPVASLLRGVRVLDASRVLAGPYCGQLLADLGAEVIKVERPGSGDETRQWGPPFRPSGDSAYYLSCNRNKRGVALDLSSPRGRELLHRLVRVSDIVLENYRADSAEKLGLSPAQLHAVNPRAIVCSISGFGRTGPLADLPGYDFAVQAMSGLMSITGPREGPPCKVGVAVIDVLTGLYACTAVLACLVARVRSGHGYAIDLALLDCAVAAQVNVVQAYLTRMEAGVNSEDAAPGLQGNAHLQIVPYQLFATLDGWLVLAVGNDAQWARFARAAVPILADDERFTTNPERVRHREILVPLLETIFRSKPTSEWVRLLESIGVPHAPLWNYADLFAQPQATERGYRVTVRDPQGCAVDLVGSPFHIQGDDPGREATYPPGVGEHTTDVLGELCGLGADELEGLRAEGVIE